MQYKKKQNKTKKLTFALASNQNHKKLSMNMKFRF